MSSSLHNTRALILKSLTSLKSSNQRQVGGTVACLGEAFSAQNAVVVLLCCCTCTLHTCGHRKRGCAAAHRLDSGHRMETWWSSLMYRAPLQMWFGDQTGSSAKSLWPPPVAARLLTLYRAN